MKKNNVISINAGEFRERVLARRDELVADHLSLAAGIAAKIHRNLPPCFDLDDLVANANLALIHAATIYRPLAHNNTPFPAFARIRIYGAVIESVRRKRWLEATRPPIYISGTDEQEDCESAAMYRAATQPVAPAAIDRGRERKRVAEAASWLPREQQRVLALYYAVDEPTFESVARRIGTSLQDVRQLHRLAVTELQKRLKKAA